MCNNKILIMKKNLIIGSSILLGIVSIVIGKKLFKSGNSVKEISGRGENNEEPFIEVKSGEKIITIFETKSGYYDLLFIAESLILNESSLNKIYSVTNVIDIPKGKDTVVFEEKSEDVKFTVNKGEIVTLVYVGKYSILERLKYGAIYFTGEIKVKGI